MEGVLIPIFSCISNKPPLTKQWENVAFVGNLNLLYFFNLSILCFQSIAVETYVAANGTKLLHKSDVPQLTDSQLI